MTTAIDKAKFIEGVFGAGRLSARGENLAVKCPVCDASDKSKRKLSIRLDDDLNHCWVCGWSASNLLPLLMKYGSRNDVEIYKRNFLPLAQKKKAEAALAALPALPADFKLLALHMGSSDPDVKAAVRYAKNRGLSMRDIAYYAFGTSDEFKHRRRVIMPSFDHEGNLNYVVSRAIDDSVYMKYLNSENPKTDIIFNELKIDWSRPLTVVEGPFDLVKCADNATCLLGSEMNEQHRLFVKILEKATPVVLCLDNDARKKCERIVSKLLSYDISVSIARLPDERDPGKLTKDEMVDVIKAARPWSRQVSLADRINNIRAGSLRIS